MIFFTPGVHKFIKTDSFEGADWLTGAWPSSAAANEMSQQSTFDLASQPSRVYDVSLMHKLRPGTPAMLCTCVLLWGRPHHVLILSVCLSVPCLHLEGKRKGLRIPNLIGRVPGTPAPRGPISRSRGQRSRSRRLIALLAKNQKIPPPKHAHHVASSSLNDSQDGSTCCRRSVARTYSTAWTAP